MEKNKELTVAQVAKLTGISVRTLHHYHQIGLLSPSHITAAGYRFYGIKELERLQQILFYKELDFSLEDIARLLDAPGYDKSIALSQHRHLLTLRRKRLDGLITLTDQLLKGETVMSFQEFDMKKIEETKEKYAKEAEERWGGTDAYAQSQKRTNSYNKEDWARIQGEAQAIYDAFAAAMKNDPASDAVQALVARWQQHITHNYYDCTKEILAGLGQMYTADQRFTQNIDKTAPGLAAFISSAIEIYCK